MWFTGSDLLVIYLSDTKTLVSSNEILLPMFVADSVQAQSCEFFVFSYVLVVFGGWWGGVCFFWFCGASPPPRYLSLKVWKKASIFSFGILLTTNFTKLSYGLGGLSTTRQSSTMFKIATSNRCSLFTLSSAVQISVKIKSNVTSVPYVATDNSLDWRSGSLP